jgi:RND family efflux transporter MFP subunit
MKLHHQFIILLSSTILILGGCAKKNEAIEKKPIEVKVMPMHKSNRGVRQNFSGTVEEQNGSSISFSTAGTVKSVAIAEGQRVHKGQLIATLDDAQFQSSYNMAKATLDQAQDAYNRLKILHDNNSLPEIQWVEAESKLKQAQSTYDISKKNLADTRLYAPFSGFISEKSIEVGNNVMPGSPVAKLVTVDNVKVCIAVPETEISNIKQGDIIEIEVPALNNQTFSGKIIEKGVAANSLSRSYQVKAEIKNPSNLLLPGMLCTLYIGAPDAAESVMLLARNVIQLDSNNRNFVWVNNNGKASRKYVDLGDFAGENVVIKSGLNEGDQVIVEGQQKISDDMSITVIK